MLHASAGELQSDKKRLKGKCGEASPKVRRVHASVQRRRKSKARRFNASRAPVIQGNKCLCVK